MWAECNALDLNSGVDTQDYLSDEVQLNAYKYKHDHKKDTEADRVLRNGNFK